MSQEEEEDGEKEEEWGVEAKEEGEKATNNYHKSSSSQHFHMLRWPVIGSSLGSVCVYILSVFCVCLLCLAHPELLSHSVFASP